MPSCKWSRKENAGNQQPVLMVGYTLDGISNQKQTKWLSWNVDGGVRGFDLARNPGLSNTTEYGAGEFPFPTIPLAGTWTQSASKASSLIRSHKTEESYPDLSNLGSELERAQGERDKANLDRDQAILGRDQAKLEPGQASLDWALMRAEREQEHKLQESEANCDRIKLEIKRLQRKQQEVASGKERKVKTMTDPLTTRLKPESRMEVDEAPRSSGRVVV